MADSIASPAATDAFIIVSAIIGILFALFQFKLVSRISLSGAPGGGNQETLVSGVNIDTSKLIGIYEAIREGADSFLKAEYTICAYFILAFGIVVPIIGDEHVLEPGGGSRTGDGGDRFERRRPLGNRMVSDRKADSEPHAQRRPRTSRPGRAPVSTPSRRVTSPATIVAR